MPESPVATYKEIQSFIKERHGYVAKTCWIADVKARHGLTGRTAPNRQGPHRVHPCPKEKVGHVKEALTHFGMV